MTVSFHSKVEKPILPIMLLLTNGVNPYYFADVLLTDKYFDLDKNFCAGIQPVRFLIGVTHLGVDCH